MNKGFRLRSAGRFAGCFLAILLVLQMGMFTVSQTGPTPPAPPDIFDPPNCDSPILVPTQGPLPPAGPPCPPPPAPPAPPAPQPIPPQPPVGPETCLDPNDPFGPGPHIIGALPTGPLPPAGPPLPPCEPALSEGVELLLPPSYRVGSAPYFWVKTDESAYVYVIDVDPQRSVFVMPGPGVSVANTWHLFGVGVWLENPIGTDSINVVVSPNPLSASLQAAITNPEFYSWGGEYYILNSTIQHQLVSVGASYIHQSYQVTN